MGIARQPRRPLQLKTLLYFDYCSLLGGKLPLPSLPLYYEACVVNAFRVDL